MALHKGLLNGGFKLPSCEKHFHDHDEAWLMLAGQGTGYWIDHDGKREEFVLQAGDVWMIPAGFEHGLDGADAEFTIQAVHGTYAPGSHQPGHYYMEKEGYIPSLQLAKAPTGRYRSPATMRGVIFPEKGKAALQDEARPFCQPGHILCQTVYSGVSNGTERNVLMGGNYGGSWPTHCGYQNVGCVLEVGTGVKDYAVGDLIFSGDHCQHVACFALEALDASRLVIKLPKEIDPKHAALFGVASVGLHDVRRAGTKIGDKVLVVGAGVIGQLTAQAARAAGAVVTICDLDAHRLKIARQLGAHHAVTITGDEAWAGLKNLGPFDIVIEDSGAPVLDKLIGGTWGQGLVKYRGKVVMIAGRNRVDYSFNACQSMELEIVHASHFVLDDLQQLCRLVAEGVIQIGPVIQDVVPISQAVAIYDRLRDQPNSLLGTVFDWQ